MCGAYGVAGAAPCQIGASSALSENSQTGAHAATNLLGVGYWLFITRSVCILVFLTLPQVC